MRFPSDPWLGATRNESEASVDDFRCGDQPPGTSDSWTGGRRFEAMPVARGPAPSPSAPNGTPTSSHEADAGTATSPRTRLFAAHSLSAVRDGAAAVCTPAFPDVRCLPSDAPPRVWCLSTQFDVAPPRPVRRVDLIGIGILTAPCTGAARICYESGGFGSERALPGWADPRVAPRDSEGRRQPSKAAHLAGDHRGRRPRRTTRRHVIVNALSRPARGGKPTGLLTCVGRSVPLRDGGQGLGCPSRSESLGEQERSGGTTHPSRSGPARPSIASREADRPEMGCRFLAQNSSGSRDARGPGYSWMATGQDWTAASTRAQPLACSITGIWRQILLCLTTISWSCRARFRGSGHGSSARCGRGRCCSTPGSARGPASTRSASGIRCRANAGFQHSSRMVPCTRSTQPLVCGRPAWMKRCLAPSEATVCPKATRAELGSVI